MQKERKYLIFSPINEYGGVNIEVSFIANLLAEKNPVEIISLGNYFLGALGKLPLNVSYNSLDRILYQENFLIRSSTNLLCAIKPLSLPNHFRVENLLTKIAVINLRRKKIKKIQEAISGSAVIIICSQLTSHLVKEIVEISFQQNKKIIFRLTGQIQAQHLNEENIPWLKKVSTFIHHSSKSQNKLSNFLRNSNNIIIDQTSILEEELLKIDIKKTRIKKFFTLSRWHPIKNIDTIIEAFTQQSTDDDELNIYGDGEEENKLKKLVQNRPNIHLKGKIEYHNIPEVFKQNDCLIISSFNEAGPITGIESIAAGVPVISSRVGAMEDRLGIDYQFFFNGQIKDLEQKINKVRKITPSAVYSISKNLRKVYLQNYLEENIKNEYKKILLNI